MSGEIVAAQMVTGFILIIFVYLIGAFFWRLMRSTIRRAEMIDAYFTAKLKKHAEKFSVDLNSEMKETNNFYFWTYSTKTRAERKQQRLNTNAIANTDLLFEALEDQEDTKSKK